MTDRKLVGVVNVAVIVDADGGKEYVVGTDFSADESSARTIYKVLPLVSHALAKATASDEHQERGDA